jgi:hypothetical protein
VVVLDGFVESSLDSVSDSEAVQGPTFAPVVVDLAADDEGLVVVLDGFGESS